MGRDPGAHLCGTAVVQTHTEQSPLILPFAGGSALCVWCFEMTECSSEMESHVPEQMAKSSLTLGVGSAELPPGQGKAGNV